MESENKSQTIVEARDLKKVFSLKKGFGSALGVSKEILVRAVDGVNLEIQDGEIFGIVGESGCGKTTLGKLLIRLLEPTDGVLRFRNQDITHMSMRNLRKLRREMQIIYQDPFNSLPVRYTVSQILMEPLKIHNLISNKEEGISRAKKLLEDVELVPTELFLKKHPNELSGGQRQRVGIARAIALKPKFIIADEPVSMLDLSVRAEILNLLLALKRNYGLTMILITHDLANAQFMCNRVGIMYVGKIVEVGRGEDIFSRPQHPYTMLLKAALPTLDPRTKHHLSDLPTEEEIANPIDLPSGCRFHPRCIYKRKICKEKDPDLQYYDDREIACHAIDNWI
ncbi:MAG: oligopeptide/dipeptide ABC transporter ATP-binding protein [Candidatus Hodarchaeales archaeon]|jgi:peptide/nickel transport system ATP-binding protein